MEAILETVPVMPVAVMAGLLQIVWRTEHADVSLNLAAVAAAVAMRTRDILLLRDSGSDSLGSDAQMSAAGRELLASGGRHDECLALHANALLLLWTWSSEESGTLPLNISLVFFPSSTCFDGIFMCLFVYVSRG